MAKTFKQMVQAAKEEVPGVTPQDAQKRLLEDSNAILLEVRDPGNVPSSA